MDFDTFLTVASFVMLAIVTAIRVALQWNVIRQSRKRKINGMRRY